tara:strand:+ start:1203 stop:1304 length:102 start_codon:yes stop_codon:yes gene_type:complete
MVLLKRAANQTVVLLLVSWKKNEQNKGENLKKN